MVRSGGACLAEIRKWLSVSDLRLCASIGIRRVTKQKTRHKVAFS